MPLRERVADLMASVPKLLTHNNVKMLSNPSSSGKKAVAEATKQLGELTTSMKFHDATLAAASKHLQELPGLAMEEETARTKVVEDLLRQAEKSRLLIVKNVQTLEKLVPVIKKEYGIK